MEIRDYKKGDEVEILKLFSLVFKKEMPLNYWNWRFIQNPVNKIMIKLMWENSFLIGHYAVSPVVMDIEGEQHLSALSMTTMTHPDHFGKGIFTQLAEELYNIEFNQSNLKAIWGFPNNNSHYAFIKNLKWKDLVQIPNFSILTSLLPKSSCKQIIKGSSFSKSHELAAKSITLGFGVKTLRNSAYLDWRYLRHPIIKYDISEFQQGDMCYYLVSKLFESFEQKGKYEIDLLDIIIPNDYGILLEFLNYLLVLYSEKEVVKINCWIPLFDEKHLLFEKAGFVNNEIVTYMGVKVMDNNLKSLHNNEKWFYSFGDSDIY